jgi:hypothetical protein
LIVGAGTNGTALQPPENDRRALCRRPVTASKPA